MLNLIDILSDLFDGFGEERDDRKHRQDRRRSNDRFNRDDEYEDRREHRRVRDFDFFGD